MTMRVGVRCLGRLAPALVCLVLAGAWAWFAASHAFDDDEFQHAHIAWLISRGVVPYRDFFEHHSPLYHLIASALFLLPSGVWQIFFLRAGSVLCGLGSMFLIFALCRKRYGILPGIGAVWLTAFVPMFFLKMMEARPDSPALLCLTAALVLVFWHGEVHIERAFFAAGALLAAATLLSVKFGLPALGLCAAAVIVRGRRYLLPAALGGLVPCAALAAYLVSQGILSDFIRSVIVANFGWKHRFSPAGYLFELWSTAGTLVAMGLAGVAGESGGHGRRICLGLTVYLAACVMELLLISEPYRQAFLPLFPALAIGAGSLGRQVARFAGRSRGTLASAAVFLLLAALPSFRTLAEEIGQTNADDLRVISLIERIDPSGGPVFDGRGLMFFRMHTGFHACMHRGILMMIDADRFAEETVRELQRLNYPVVIKDYRVREMPARLLSFIEDHYRQIDASGVMVPGFSVDRALLPAGGTEIQVPASGAYRGSWVGDPIRIDGTPVRSGQTVRLTRGSHRFSSDGFAEEIEFLLEERE